MAVAIDTTILSLLFDPTIKPPNDPSTNKPVERTKERIDYFVDQLEAAGTRILIPTPVLAEFLVIANESGGDYLADVSHRSVFEVVPFDQTSAIEAAALQRRAISAGNKKADLKGSRQCLKVDRQIVAVCKFRQVDAIYTSDVDVQKIAGAAGVAAIMLWDMPLPPESERDLPFDGDSAT